MLKQRQNVQRATRSCQTTGVSRRTLLVVGAAAVVGLIVTPFLPRTRTSAADDLLKPELAQANPQLIRELCLEFYDHPKVAYRGAAAAHMAEFEDPEIQTVLLSRLCTEVIPHVQQALARSIVTHRDPNTYAQIATLYWQQPNIRSSVDALALAYGLTALQTVIMQAKP